MIGGPMSEQSESNSAASINIRRALLPIFLTLFLDLVGFSIIFPLFPAMLDYYLAENASDPLLAFSIYLIDIFRGWLGGESAVGKAVLFGGLLGSLYSLLQFVCAPIMGSISDKVGRRPVLLTCLIGLTVSHALWIFAAPFTLLVIARFIGGIMSANISTATAAVADITPENKRSAGMAVIGVAFGLGFILGPAIGGISALVNLVDLWPNAAAIGLNPFSAPAVVAFVLSVANVLFVYFRFTETLPPEKRGQGDVMRTANPVTLFKTSGYPGVRLTNMTYFVFLTAFSGMEFSLTFLAAERLNFGPMELGLLLLYVGVILVLMQGGYVRRKADIAGPKRIALQGFVCVIPAMAIIAYAPNLWWLLGGLTLMGVGSSQVLPCLTSLASLYAPAEEQGRILGVFRSLGALARAVGPVIACVVYWRLGSGFTYYACAAVLILPLIMALRLPPPQKTAEN